MWQQIDRLEGRNDSGGNKEGDKVKECSETTGSLFLLKERPRHSALVRGYKYPSMRRGLTGLSPANGNPNRKPKSSRLISTDKLRKQCQ